MNIVTQKQTIPLVDQLRRNIETVKGWQGKKPEEVLRRLVDGLQRLIEKYKGK